MEDKRITPNELPDLPISGESMTGATGGASVPRRALERGFLSGSEDDSAMDADSFLSTYDNNGGFLGRPNGWER